MINNMPFLASTPGSVAGSEETDEWEEVGHKNKSTITRMVCNSVNSLRHNIMLLKIIYHDMNVCHNMNTRVTQFITFT